MTEPSQVFSLDNDSDGTASENFWPEVEKMEVVKTVSYGSIEELFRYTNFDHAYSAANT